jgi:hypothetical protein
MADFLGGNNDFDDFERAASAFPDINIDGSGDIPSIPAGNNQHSTSSVFLFDDFDTMPSAPPGGSVKVTGDDEIENFENEFPDIEVAPAPVLVCSLLWSAGWHFADRVVYFCSHRPRGLRIRALHRLPLDLSLLRLLLHQSSLRRSRKNQK